MLNYTASIFQESGSDLDPHISAIVIAAIQILGVYCSTNLVDRVGRKTLLTFSTCGAFVGLASLGTYSYLTTEVGMDLRQLNWVPLISFSTFLFISCFGIVPLPFIVLTEILPAKVHAKYWFDFDSEQAIWGILFFFLVRRYVESGKRCACCRTVYSRSSRWKRFRCSWAGWDCMVWHGSVRPCACTEYSLAFSFWKRLKGKISTRLTTKTERKVRHRDQFICQILG